MSIRQEMLEAASRGARTLGDADAVEAFVLSHLCQDGGFRGRSADSDLYYTAFAVQILDALKRPFPRGLAAFLAGFGGGESLDLVHLCCLARCWACAGDSGLPLAAREAMRQGILRFRSRDGGFAVQPGQARGSAYGCFVALSGLQDLDECEPSGGLSAGLRACVGSLERPGGGFANENELPFAMTPSTAAAIVVLQQIGQADGASSVAAAADWLLARIGSDGGFAVFDGGPSDLLSTATALHALDGVKMQRETGETGTDTGAVVVPGVCPRFPRKVDNVGVSPRFCRDYVLGLRTPDGGFCGGIGDRVSDCEYTFYGLLAMGHLSPE